jgi:peptide/nickel transport system substrate-binding protein
MRVKHPFLVLLTLLSFVAGCASPIPRTTETGAGNVGIQSGQRSGQKVLTLVGREGVIGNFPGVTGGGGGRGFFVLDYLTATDPNEEEVPRLAQEVISVENGTWRVNPDGTMDTIWKLRPNVKWQDGAPFSADDLMFSYTAFKDPALPSLYGEALKLMTSAETIDPLTFVVHWSEVYAGANKAPGLDPMPKHLLEELYLTDKTAFPESSFFRRDFIGTGAYRIKHWEPGAYVEYERFDDYYLGRPALDSVVMRFMSDKNTILSNVLAGTFDVVYNKDALDVEAGMEAERRWAGTTNTVTWTPTHRTISIEPQYRPEFARPTHGMAVRDVREAMLHAVDRQAMIEAITYGKSPIADHWISPISKWRSAVEGAAPHYDYDLPGAQQMLADAGWTMGADGVLVDSTGERFETDLWNRFQFQRDQAVLADFWKTVGIQMNVKQLPVVRDRELEAKIAGGQIHDQTVNDYGVGRLRSADISSPANRYNGRNLAGYSNPRFDAVLATLHATIDQNEAAKVHRELVREAFTDLAIMPFYFQVTPLLMRDGITGPVAGGAEIYWNFFEWDKKS